jgi:hypothetical protein
MEREEKVSNVSRISAYEYIFMFILIIYAGRANIYLRSSLITEYPVAFLLPALLAGILAIKWKVTFNRQFLLLIFGYFIYFTAISIKYQAFHPTVLINHLVIFFIPFVVIQSLRFNALIIYEYLLFILAAVALMLWIVQIILGGSSLYSILSNISFFNETSYVSTGGINIIIFSIPATPHGELIPRNFGYAWEPGGFAIYLCLAIFINLFISRDHKKSNLRFWVLLVALLSTQSTTGFFILSIIAFYYFVNQRTKLVFLLIPIFFISIIAIFSLPFMGEKMMELFDEVEQMDQIIKQRARKGSSLNAQRFLSLALASKEFNNNPILGTGATSQVRWTDRMGADISIISGIGNILINYGLIGMIFFILATLKSSFIFAKYFNYKGKLLLFIIVLSISISYGVLLSIIMMFWAFSLATFQNNGQIDGQLIIYSK